MVCRRASLPVPMVSSIKLPLHHIFKTESGLKSGSRELVLMCVSLGFFTPFAALAASESPFTCVPSGMVVAFCSRGASCCVEACVA